MDDAMATSEQAGGAKHNVQEGATETSDVPHI